LGVYLRLLDVAVPWSYGGSADEAPGGWPASRSGAFVRACWSA